MFLLILIIASVDAETKGEIIKCDGIIFNHVYFDRELLAVNLGRPYNLVMHKFSGILFFSHTYQNGTHIDFGIMACHLANNNCKEINGIPGGYAIAYDTGNDDIYFGGHDGIYKYNFLTQSAEFFAQKGRSIWGLFIKKSFYYIEYPSQKLYVFQDDKFVHVAEGIRIEIDIFFISKHVDIYFANKTALYKLINPNKEVVVLDDELIIRQIVEDGYGDVYFCASDGIYIEDKPYHRTKKVAHINQAFGLTFDEQDHIIYSDEDAIYRLLPSKYSEACFKAIHSPAEEKVNDINKHALIS